MSGGDPGENSRPGEAFSATSKRKARLGNYGTIPIYSRGRAWIFVNRQGLFLLCYWIIWVAGGVFPLPLIIAKRCELAKWKTVERSFSMWSLKKLTPSRGKRNGLNLSGGWGGRKLLIHTKYTNYARADTAADTGLYYRLPKHRAFLPKNTASLLVPNWGALVGQSWRSLRNCKLFSYLLKLIYGFLYSDRLRNFYSRFINSCLGEASNQPLSPK